MEDSIFSFFIDITDVFILINNCIVSTHSVLTRSLSIFGIYNTGNFSMIWSELTQPTSIWRDNAKKAMAEDYTVNNANNVIEVKQGYDNQAVDKE